MYVSHAAGSGLLASNIAGHWDDSMKRTDVPLALDVEKRVLESEQLVNVIGRHVGWRRSDGYCDGRGTFVNRVFNKVVHHPSFAERYH